MKNIFVFMMLLFSGFIVAQNPDAQPDRKKPSVFNTQVPAHSFDVIAGAPTPNSVSLSVLFYTSATACVEYTDSRKHLQRTPVQQFEAGKPTPVVLSALKPNEKYHYHLVINNVVDSTTYFFHTARTPASGFVFSITADSHLDENADVAVYARTLRNAAADSIDFHIDLGDTFMTDKYRDNYTDAFRQYLAQRYYFSLLKVPLFLVLGNHDGEQGSLQTEKLDWATQQRTRFFPNPDGSNTFYTSGSTRGNYYAWTWGNTLFVVLDPFRYTPRSGADDLWARTLGKTQYDWLKTTLAQSKATFKLVFIHNLVGGADVKGRGRGGAAVAGYYEWGGANSDGSPGFLAHRPGWDMPVHDLLAHYGVNIVFHGHDHLCATEKRGTIVYQCVSQPGSKRTGFSAQINEYGYQGEDMTVDPGFMRVTVSPSRLLLDFISTTITSGTQRLVVLHHYELNH